jgi:hypothetical protein
MLHSQPIQFSSARGRRNSRFAGIGCSIKLKIFDSIQKQDLDRSPKEWQNQSFPPTPSPTPFEQMQGRSPRETKRLGLNCIGPRAVLVLVIGD